MAFAPVVWTAIAAVTGAVTGVASFVTGLSAQQAAAKKAKSQAEQAERIRAEELEKAKPLIAEVEALPEKAKAEAAAIAAGKKRKRETLVTGPRGLLAEPAVAKPTLLGA